ncbi:ADP-ribosyltransferase-containing protein [Xanthomonas euvesicatoria]
MTINYEEAAMQLLPESSVEFREWLAGSQLTNDDGSPIVVYHGTDELFDDYRLDLSRSATGVAFNGAGIYFCRDPNEARLYGKHLRAAVLSLRKPAALFTEQREGTLQLCSRLGITSLRPRGVDASIGAIGETLQEVSSRLTDVHAVPAVHQPGFYHVHGTYGGKLWSVHQRVISEVADEDLQRRVLALRVLREQLGMPDPDSLGHLGQAFDPFLLTSELKAAGYDGVIAEPAFPLRSLEYIAFSAEQVWDLGYIPTPADDLDQGEEPDAASFRP